MGRTFKVARRHHEGKLCVVILSVADKTHSWMDGTQMLSHTQNKYLYIMTINVIVYTVSV